MFQNVKVDIIYYQINTDFEMEFNLCGCCRMRLLTEKTTDRKNLVHALARAVSRSRVILICGALFGEDGILSVVARSVGKELTPIDAKTYGIDSNAEIKILDGATPLVSPEGLFGGCIIESGPQTIILLTENKNIRKSIMENLIHSYIGELSLIAEKEPEQQENMTQEPESVQDETEVDPEETAVSDDEKVDETGTNGAQEVTEKNADELPSEDETSGINEQSDAEEQTAEKTPSEKLPKQEQEADLSAEQSTECFQDGEELLNQTFEIHQKQKRKKEPKGSYYEGELSEQEGDFFCGKGGM